MSSRTTSAVLLALVAVAAVPGRSGAADSKTIGLTNCSTQNNDPLGLEFTASGVKNASGALLMLECSLNRDNVGNTNGLSDVEITVTDPRGRLVCDLFSFDRDGNILQMSERVAAGPGRQVLDFGNSLTVSGSRGHYGISCFMDIGTQVHSIYVNEF